MASLRIYVDTSVFGGCFDREFALESNRFFDLVRRKLVTALVSVVVIEELEDAPIVVRQMPSGLPQGFLVRVPIAREVIELRNAFLGAKIVGQDSINDATHVAAATVARADAITSWNFRHIVRLDKIRMYNGVSQQLGYPPISIVSPQEIRFDE
jgi:hypothetical protein